MTLNSEIKNILLSQLALRQVDGSPSYASMADVEAAFPELAKLDKALTEISENWHSGELMLLKTLLQGKFIEGIFSLAIMDAKGEKQ